MMPEKRDPQVQGGSSFPPVAAAGTAPDWAEACALAWERLDNANTALGAVNDTGSKELSRSTMRLVRDRALAFAAAMEQALKETEA